MCHEGFLILILIIHHKSCKVLSCRMTRITWVVLRYYNFCMWNILLNGNNSILMVKDEKFKIPLMPYSLLISLLLMISLIFTCNWFATLFQFRKWFLSKTDFKDQISAIKSKKSRCVPTNNFQLNDLIPFFRNQLTNRCSRSVDFQVTAQNTIRNKMQADTNFFLVFANKKLFYKNCDIKTLNFIF